MFVIKIKTQLHDNKVLRKVLNRLSLYNIKFYSLYISEGDTIRELIIVNEELRKGDLRLTELMFQMDRDFIQTEQICPICAKKGEISCGHLIFVPT